MMLLGEFKQHTENFRKAIENRHLASPHLHLILAQMVRAGKLSAEIRATVEEAYREAIAEQSASEIGYSRPEGQCFNPRAARIALILIQDAEVTSGELLTEGIRLAGLGESYRGYLNGEGAAEVRAASLLDRIRHLHKENHPDKDALLLAARTAVKILPVSKLSLLLEKAIGRVERKS